MQTVTGAVVAVSLILLSGCNTCGPNGATEASMQLTNGNMVQSFFSEAADNAVITQRTIFPYHFVPGTADLTSLGLQNLSLLTAYYKENPGPLSVRRGAVSDALYAARVESVRAFLKHAEVNLDKMCIADKAPDGDGMASDRVVDALSDKKNNSSSKTFPISISNDSDKGLKNGPRPKVQ